METTYNAILTELLWYAGEKEFINGYIEEFVMKGILLEVENLNEKSWANEPYAELKKLLDKTLETNQEKLHCIRAQDFEGAATLRSEQRRLIDLMEQYGFNLYLLEEDKFVLYHVEEERKVRKLRFTVYSNSNECIKLLEEVRIKVTNKHT